MYQCFRDERGLSTMEYAVLFVLIVVAALAVWSKLAARLNARMTAATSNFESVLSRSNSSGTSDTLASDTWQVPSMTNTSTGHEPMLRKDPRFTVTTKPDPDDGGTKDLWRTCQSGDQIACKNLEITNGKQLKGALAHIKRVAPDLVDPDGMPVFKWDDSEEFWKEANGATNMTGSTITLARGYSSERDLVDTVAHELGHVRQGYSERLATAWEDYGEDKLGPRHQAIVDRAAEISNSYPENPQP
jgi:Flp pilus assembly pilin Flp